MDNDAENLKGELLPREGKLFFSKYGNDYFTYGNGFAYKINPKSLQIIEKQQNLLTQDYSKPFHHYYQCVLFDGQYYGIIKQQLVIFQGFDIQTLQQVPSQCNEKYKIFVYKNELTVIDDKGQGYTYKKQKQFTKTQIQQIQGDSYVTSHNNVSVILNNTQHTINIEVKDQSFQSTLDQYVTVDFLTAYYCIAHSDANNVFIDFTNLIYAVLNEQQADASLITQFSSGKRIKEIEWNRICSVLLTMEDQWTLDQEYMQLFMELNVGQFLDRFAGLVKLGQQSGSQQQKRNAIEKTPQRQKVMQSQGLADMQLTQQQVQQIPPQIVLNQNQQQLQSRQQLEIQNQILQNQLKIQQFNDQNLEPQALQNDTQNFSTDRLNNMVIKQNQEINMLKFQIEQMQKEQLYFKNLFKLVIEKCGEHWPDVLQNIVDELGQ